MILFKLIMTLIAGTIAYVGFQQFMDPKSVMPKITVKGKGKKKSEVMITPPAFVRPFGLVVAIVAVLMLLTVWFSF